MPQALRQVVLESLQTVVVEDIDLLGRLHKAQALLELARLSDEARAHVAEEQAEAARDERRADGDGDHCARAVALKELLDRLERPLPRLWPRARSVDEQP